METHRPGPFKQRNKTHKSGKKRSHRDLANGGRARTTSLGSVRSLGSKKGSAVAKTVRKNQLTQQRKLKREELLNARRGIAVAPILIAVLDLHDSQNNANISSFFANLQSMDSSAKCFTSPQHPNRLHLELPKFRATYEIVLLQKRDLFGALDLIKIVDILLLLHSPETEAILETQQETGQQSDAHYLLDAIYNHCLPQTVHALVGLNQVSNTKQKDRIRKTIQDLVERQYPGTLDGGVGVKLRSLDTAQDLLQLFHYCSNVKRKPSSYASRRSQLLAEQINYEPNPDNPENGNLLVEGYIRNTAFNVNALVYVPEFGEFQLDSVEGIRNPYLFKDRPLGYEDFVERADPELRPPLDERENPIETLYEQEMADLGDGDDDDDDDILPSEKEDKKRVLEKKKVPKGTSDYQAAWIFDSDDENENETAANGEESESDDEEMLDAVPKKKSVTFAPVDQLDEFEVDAPASGDVPIEDDQQEMEEDQDADYDAMNVDDADQLERFKEQRNYEQFPDEIDTPAQVPARERFAKYRGLKSFRTSTWDVKENLPADYSRISQFQNFSRTKRRLFKTEPIGADAGYYVRARLLNVPRAVFDYYTRPDKPLVLFQLLAHEHKMSVMNIVLKKVASFTEPVESKEELIFHIGCRRFAANPIYSAHTVGDKHKYEKYLRSDVACVATLYAPITFPPAPVLAYKRYPSGEQVLVATGSLLDCSPDRLVIKRYVLSGHPLKINRKHAVVRYMFFNREDILWFRPVELRTKYGRRGHITEPLGTHGHMKCVFDHQLNSQDTVLMCLYKRVFPKWTYRAEGLGEPARPELQPRKVVEEAMDS